MDTASRSVSDGDLYTVEQRLQTFENAHWPYETGSCTPLKMAEAGFYFCGTINSPDWVRCVTCHHELDGWEEGDVPLKEHQQHSPDCHYIKNIKDPYNITVGDVLELEKSAAKMFIKKEVDKFRSDAQEYYETVLETLYNKLDQMTGNN